MGVATVEVRPLKDFLATARLLKRGTDLLLGFQLGGQHGKKRSCIGEHREAQAFTEFPESREMHMKLFPEKLSLQSSTAFSFRLVSKYL